MLGITSGSTSLYGLLYSQYGSTAGNDNYDSTYWSLVTFEGETGTRIQIADDFTVPSPGWSVNTIQVFGEFFPDASDAISLAVSWTIQIYPNISGYYGPIPALTPLYSNTLLPSNGRTSPNPIFTISPSLVLPAGTYWVSAFINIDSASTNVGWSAYTISSRFQNSWRMLDSTGYFIGIDNKGYWMTADYFGVESGLDLQFEIRGASAVTSGSTTQLIATTSPRGENQGIHSDGMMIRGDWTISLICMLLVLAQVMD